MSEEYNTRNSTNSIIDRDLSPGVVNQLINTNEAVRNVLQQICDFKPVYENNKVISLKLGKLSLVNEKGLKNISGILYGISNKDVGIGFRNEKRINDLMRYTMRSLIIDIKHNFMEWRIKFNDITTILTIIKYFLVGVLSKSYKGHSLKLVAGSMEAKEQITTQEKKKKGLGGIFGFPNKNEDE